MHKLHATLLSSPAPALLEIRILANHGADPRFSFLRKGGKWREVWEEIRREKPAAVVEEEREGGSALVAYGSSDEDEESGEDFEEAKEEEVEVEPTVVESASVGPTNGTGEDEDRRRKKAEKARVWAEKRKAARELAP